MRRWVIVSIVLALGMASAVFGPSPDRVSAQTPTVVLNRSTTSLNYPFKVNVNNIRFEPQAGLVAFDFIATPARVSNRLGWKSGFPNMIRGSSFNAQGYWLDGVKAIYMPNFDPLSVYDTRLGPGGSITFEASKAGFEPSDIPLMTITDLAYVILQLVGIEPPQHGFDTAIALARELSAIADELSKSYPDIFNYAELWNALNGPLTLDTVLSAGKIGQGLLKLAQNFGGVARPLGLTSAQVVAIGNIINVVALANNGAKTLFILTELASANGFQRVQYDFSGGPGGSRPSPPADLRAAALDNRIIRLSWSDNSGNESGFRIREGSALVATVGAGVSTHTIGNLSAGSTHCYTVVAFNSSGESGPSNQACATTLGGGGGRGAPAAPSNLRATALSGSEIRLTWNDNSGTESGFRIIEGSTIVATVGPNGSTTASHTVGGLTAGSTHCYRVTAFNANGSSAASNQACATPASGPSLSLTVSPTSGQVGVAVSVRAVSSDASYNTVRVSMDCGTPDRYEIGGPEAQFTWNTGGCSATAHTLVAEARRPDDPNWAHPLRATQVMTLSPAPEPDLKLEIDPTTADVGATISIRAAARDPAYNTVRVTTGCGTPDRYEIGSPTAQFTWNTRGCPDGSRTVVAEARTSRDVNWTNPIRATKDVTLRDFPVCNPPTADEGVYLFPQRNYCGGAVRFTADDPDLTDNGLNDNVRSIYTIGPFRTTLFRDPNYAGFAETVNWADTDLTDNLIGNSASSVRIERFNCDLNSPGVVLFSAPNFNGACKRFTLDDPDLSDDGIEDAVYSLRLIGGYEATLCQGRNFSSACQRFAADVADLSQTSFGNGASSVRVHTPPPAAPGNLQASAVDSSHIRLVWNDNSFNEDGFRILEGGTTVATAGANTTATAAYTVAGLAPNSTHCYTVTAFNNAGTSAVSNQACATTPPPDPGPTGYAFRRDIVITNSMPGTSLPAGYPVRLRFDASTTPTAADIFNASQTTPKCNDVRVFSFGTELDRFIQSCTTSVIDIWFRTQVTIPGGALEDRTHQLYYGKADAGVPPGGMTSVFDPPLDADTVGLWYMNEQGGSTLADSSGGGITCALDGTTSWVTPAKFTGALRFLGGTDGPTVNCGAPPALNLQNFTFELWFHGTGNNWGRLAGQMTPTQRWALEYIEGRVRVVFWTTPGGAEVRSTTTFSRDTNWHHVAFTVEGTVAKLYIDGRLEGTVALPGPINSVNQTLTIGSYENGGRTFAEITHARFSNAVRTSFPYGAFAAITSEPTVKTKSAAVPTPPAAPANLQVTGTAQTSVSLAWDDRSSNETGFKVYRNGSLLTTVGSNTGTTASYQDTAVSCGTTYSYFVTATNGAGDSTASNTVSATTSACTPPSANLLPNGSFEEGTFASAGTPTGWTRDIWSPRTGTLTWDNTQARQGPKSVKISFSTPNDARWIQTVSVQPNTRYRLSGWVKTENVAHSAEVVDAGANLSLFGTWTRSTGLFGTTDWTYVSLEFNSESNTQVTVAARLGYWAGTTTGTAWFDDLRLEAMPSQAASAAGDSATTGMAGVARSVVSFSAASSPTVAAAQARGRRRSPHSVGARRRAAPVAA